MALLPILRFPDPRLRKVAQPVTNIDDAIRRLIATLDDAPLLGLQHNARFLRDLVDHPRFREGSMTTTLIDQWQVDGEPLLQRPVASDTCWLIAAALHAVHHEGHATGLRAASVAGYDLPLQFTNFRD